MLLQVREREVIVPFNNLTALGIDCTDSGDPQFKRGTRGVFWPGSFLCKRRTLYSLEKNFIAGRTYRQHFIAKTGETGHQHIQPSFDVGLPRIPGRPTCP